MPAAGILPATVAVPRLPDTGVTQLRSACFLSVPFPFPPNPLLSSNSSSGGDRSPFIIRMGGGPRTYPGGVSKWQWKRMQAKKAKQLLKARLLRERQLYEMRKRTELKAAVADLERPWEAVERVVETAPTLFFVAADEQVKALADRFQRAGGFDMWNDRDGPQVFRSPPTARVFYEGSVHSLNPYGAVEQEKDEDDLKFGNWLRRGGDGTRRIPTKALKPAERSDFVQPIDVEAKILETDGTKQGEGIVRLSKNSKISNLSRNFSRQGSNTLANQKDSSEEACNMDPVKNRETNYAESINRSKNQGNAKKQLWKNEFKPMEDARQVRYNGRTRGFQSQFSSTTVNEIASRKADTCNKVANRRTRMHGTISLRPTSPLYYSKGRYWKENGDSNSKNISEIRTTEDMHR